MSVSMDYAVLKIIHVASALISFALFFLRGLWRMADSPRLQQRWVKVVPHVNDTILLLAGVGMAITAMAHPTLRAMLTAKLIGLMVYILLGMYALRHARTRGARIASWLLALLTFCYIVAVAITKSPWLIH